MFRFFHWCLCMCEIQTFLFSFKINLKKSLLCSTRNMFPTNSEVLNNIGKLMEYVKECDSQILQLPPLLFGERETTKHWSHKLIKSIRIMTEDCRNKYTWCCRILLRFRWTCMISWNSMVSFSLTPMHEEGHKLLFPMCSALLLSSWNASCHSSAHCHIFSK